VEVLNFVQGIETQQPSFCFVNRRREQMLHKGPHLSVLASAGSVLIVSSYRVCR
jgi:hypothetical protein